MNKLVKNCFGSQITRKNFQQLQTSDIDYFRTFLSENQVKTDTLEGFNQDWMKKFQGSSQLALFPKNSLELQNIIQYCNKKLLAVVPQSGNTGLVGGSVPVFDEIIVNTQKMNQIVKFDESTNVLTLGSGVILQEANNYLQQYNCEIPWDLGAKGSCFVGGNASTHAGGKYYVKYGPLRTAILGLEVVNGNGDILDMLSEVRKDNTGIDLKQLFIGSEGTLGIITKLNVFCSNIDKQKNLILVKCKNFQGVLNTYKYAKQDLSKNLAAIEWLDGTSFQSVMDGFQARLQNPFESSNRIKEDYYVLLEINSNYNIEEIEQNFLENLMQIPEFIDCVKAQNDTQFKDLWSIRELVGPSVNEQAKYQFKYDISLDIEQMDNLTKTVRERCGKYETYVTGYGHIGDSNLHINVALMKESDKYDVENLLEPFIYEYLKNVKGSISAEHGLGLMKKQYLNYQKSNLQIDLMRNIKGIFDRNGILNPYKMIPDYV